MKSCIYMVDSMCGSAVHPISVIYMYNYMQNGILAMGLDLLMFYLGLSLRSLRLKQRTFVV